MKIRENAAELPHVMLLVDDPIDRQKIDGCQGATQEDAVNIAAVKHGIIEYVYAIRDTFVSFTIQILCREADISAAMLLRVKRQSR